MGLTSTPFFSNFRLLIESLLLSLTSLRSVSPSSIDLSALEPSSSNISSLLNSESDFSESLSTICTLSMRSLDLVHEESSPWVSENIGLMIRYQAGSLIGALPLAFFTRSVNSFH
jgi:hypothetical protein